MPVGGMFSGMAVGGMWAELQVKKARYNKDLKEAETQFSKTADNIERRANRLGKNLKKAWTGVAAATAGLAATMGGAAAISGSFENALVEVQKVTDPETMRAMKTEIQGMANVIPMAQEELSKLTADAARFGVQGVENIKSFAKTTAMMTTATELSADEAGRQMARLLEWFNLAPKYAQNIGAAVNKLSNRMPGDAADIIDALGKTGQAFEVFGASTETAIALSSVIGTLSERAVRGGTRMRRVLQELGEPDKQRKVAEALGMTADEFERMKKESPVDLLKSIAKIAVQDSEAADKLSQALSSASRTALVVLGNNLDRVNEALEMTGNQLREPTSLVKEFEAAINTLFKQLQMLWNSIKNVIIVGIGDQAKNVFLAFIKNVLRPWVVTIYDILEGNEDLQQSIFQLIKAALHIGGVITLVGLAVKMFSALLSTTTLLTAGLLALGAAWRYNAFGIRDFLKESTIKSFQQMASGIKGIVDGLQAVADIDKSEVDNKLKFAWGIGQPGGDDLKDELEQTFGTGKEGMLANKILGGMRLALGLATWSWTGSAVLGVMAATVAFDWTVAPLIGGLIEDFNDAKKRWKKKKPFSDWQNFIEEMINPEETFNAPDWVKNWPPDWIDKIEEWYDGSDMERTFDLVFNFPAAFDLFKEAWNWWNNHVGKPIADWFGKDDMERTFAFGIELKGFQPFKEAWNWWNNHTGKPLFDWFVNSFTSGSALPTTGTDTGGTIPLSELGALTVEETGFFGRAKEMIDKGDIKELNNLFDNHNSSTKQQVNAINDLLSHAESVYESDNATIDSLRESIQNLADAFGRENISPHFLNYLNPEKKQSGGPMGLIPGYGGGDRVPALLEQGEFVWPKEMVKRYPGVIKGMWEGFSRGGSVTGYGVAGPGTGESNVTGALGSLEDKLEKWIKQPPSWVGDKATFTADMRALLDVVSTFSGIQDQVNKTQKEMEKQLESTRSALEELENQSGDSGEEAKTFGEWLKKNSQVMSSVVSSLSQLASQTGVFSESQSQLIQGMSNVAQSLLSGNYIQAGLDALTAVFGSYIADLKAKREELKEKLDATYSMMNQAVSQIGQKLSSLASGVLGPFRQSLSSGVNALGSFMKMIQAGGDTVEGTTSAFSALLTIATGLIGTFSSLLKKSDAWQQLQDEMEPIWKALADALGAFLQPIIALAQWIKEYLGIQQQVNDDMKEIVEMNVPSGFKRQRLMWEAINPDELPSVSGGGGAGGGSVPTWAKNIIKPIKDALIPVLDQMKSINIAAWAKGVWSNLSQLIAVQIPKVWGWIQKLYAWWQTNGSTVLNKVWQKVVDVYNWFTNNFKGNFSKALKNIDDWFSGTTSGDFKTKLENIKNKLETVGQWIVTALGAVTGAIIGSNWGLIAGVTGAALGGAIANVLVGGGNLWDVLPFQEGGIVPGPKGAPRMVLAHGGESITPPGKKVVSTGAGKNGGGKERYQFFFNGREMSYNMRKVEGTKRYHETGSSTGGGTGRNRR